MVAINPYLDPFYVFKIINIMVYKKTSCKTVVLIIDNEKAFDSTWHDALQKQLLEAKLPRRSISSIIHTRHGCVRVNHSIS